MSDTTDSSTGHTPWESLSPDPAPIPTINSDFHADPFARETSGAALSSARSSPSKSTDTYTIPLIALGIAFIACCVLIPLGDTNRRLIYDRDKLAADLNQIDRQIAVNDEFLTRIVEDPTLAQRLALRQMKVVPKGAAVLELKSDGKKEDVSPFLLVNVPPPPAMAPYHPAPGKISDFCRDRKSRLYLLGAGMLLCAAGLVLGSSSAD